MLSDNSALLKFKNLMPEFEPFYQLLLGWIERSVELVVAKNVKTEFIARSWQGDPETIIKLSWTQ